jgi:lysozyme family protein
MANFSQAYNITAGIEAGYTVDNGGPTYKGISYKGWGDDPFAQKIFKIVFAARPRKNAFIKNKDLDTLIIAFYKKNYWDKIYGDAINNQLLANFIYDFYINSGGALSIINKAIGSTRGTFAFTESTLWQLNDKPGFCYEQIRKARVQHYNKLAQNPKLKKYKKGWLARVDVFPSNLNV